MTPERHLRLKTEEELSTQQEEIRIFSELAELAGDELGTTTDLLRKLRREGKSLASLKQERKETTDRLLGEAILRADSVETGRDAIVVRLDVTELSEPARHILEDDGVPIGAKDSVAAKMLKLYRPGEAKREFLVQQKAYKLTEGHAEYAQVPNPLALRDQNIAPKVREYLNKKGGHLDTAVEMIEMDFVKGKDLATIMYEFVLAKKGFSPELISDMSFEEKNERVAGLLDFRVATVKGASSESARQFANLIVMNENAEKLMTFLRHAGFRISPEVIDKLERTLELFQKNNIFHNDMHERNIMLEDDEPKVIDFGQSKDKSTETTTDDFAIIRRLRRLLISPEEEGLIKRNRESSELKKLSERLKDHPRWKGKLKLLEKAASKSKMTIFDQELARVKGNDQDFDIFLVCLKAIVEEHPNSGARAFTLGFMESLTDPSRYLRPYEVNKVRQVLSLIETKEEA
jgi:hypothetical protein